MLRFAYADPPYLGMAVRFYGDLHSEAAVYDTIDGHRDLIDRLSVEFDGWALSLASVNLPDILPLCPRECRVGAWVKPFCSFKPGVNPAYAWEPVIFRLARRRGKDIPTVRDWCAANITLQRGLTGAKPAAFCFWVFDVLNIQPGDEFVDLFPGSGAVADAFALWRVGRRDLLTEVA